MLNNEDYTAATSEISERVNLVDYDDFQQAMIFGCYDECDSIDEVNSCVSQLQEFTQKKHKAITVSEGIFRVVLDETPPPDSIEYFEEFDAPTHLHDEESHMEIIAPIANDRPMHRAEISESEVLELVRQKIIELDAETPEPTEFQNKINGNSYTSVDAAIEAADFSDRPAANSQPDYDYTPEPPRYFDELPLAGEQIPPDVRKKPTDKTDKLENVRPFSELTRWTNADDLADDAVAPNYSINGILEIDAHGMLAGASMAFKTFVALDIAHSVCTGADFMGKKVYTTGRVFIICGEGHGALARRIKAKKIVSGDFNDNLFVMNANIRIDNPTDMAQLKKDIDEIKPVLVIFDTFASLVGNTDENSPSAVGKTLRLIKETCRNGFTSSLTVHHTGKDASKGMRGASNFKNDVDFAFELNRESDSMITTLSCVKMKDGEEFSDIHMEARVVELGLIRQDDTQATSLILSPTNHTPKQKNKSLTDHQAKSLDALKKAIHKDGQTDIPEIVRQQFPDCPSNIPSKITTIEQWRKHAYLTMTVASKDEKSKSDSLLKAFDRTRKPLQEARRIGFYGDYAWLVEYKADTRTGQDIF
jgi:hypothetical protein